MSRDTLALAYAASTRPAQPAMPEASRAVQPAATRLPQVPDAPLRHAPPPPPEAIGDALLIAVRRSLASCRDSTQLRMLAAFEASR
jgi:hypothetical protein